MFPAALVATLIVLFMVFWARRLAAHEERTGNEKGTTLFAFVLSGSLLALWWFHESHPFIWNLMSILGGILIGGTVVYFGLLGVRALARAWSRL